MITAPAPADSSRSASCSSAAIPSCVRLIISYNSAEALKTIAARESLSVPTVVLDNGSKDNSCRMAESLGFLLIDLGKNYGFGGAIMRGLAQIDTEYVLVVNPDVGVSESALRSLIAAAERYPEADVFLPALCREDRKPFFRFDTRLDNWGASARAGRVLPEGEACLRHMSGAAFLVRRNSFLTHGFDPAIFLYFEDDDLALSYQAAKRPLIYVPSALMLHVGNVSSVPSKETEVLKARSFGWSMGYVLNKHQGGDMKQIERSLRWKYWGALVSGRWQRARYQKMVLDGFRCFLCGETAPYHPDPSSSPGFFSNPIQNHPFPKTISENRPLC